MCGIIGVFLSNEDESANQVLVDCLTLLQHRGQDAAGIITICDNRFNLRKDTGTVAEVFNQENVVRLRGHVGIGHVRYPTAGGKCTAEAQPLYTNFPFGIALAHNGNLTNTHELRQSMKAEFRHINTDSDSEVLLNVFAEELQRRRIRELNPDEVFDAIRSVMRRCKGGYAVVMLINQFGLIAFRDPNGIRPLCFGTRTNCGRTDYGVASESVALDALYPPFTDIRDVGPGEAIIITTKGELFRQTVHSSPLLSPCLFEFIYFARPDSVMDGVSVYEARLNMGQSLAKKITEKLPDHDIDVVMPIPETSRTSALQCANSLGKIYREGFVKNRYISRTFIMPGQEMRRKTVRLKLNTIKSEFKDKSVLLVDDSIVRGTTSMEIVQMARDAGARKVYFASAAPAVIFPNVYGINIPTRTELVAFDKTEEEVAAHIGADHLIFNDLKDVDQAVRSLNPSIQRFDSSCFDGEYVTGDIDASYLDELEHFTNNKHRASPFTISSSSVDMVESGSRPGTPKSFERRGSALSGSQSPKPIFAMQRFDSATALETEVETEREKRNFTASTDCESLHNDVSQSDW